MTGYSPTASQVLAPGIDLETARRTIAARLADTRIPEPLAEAGALCRAVLALDRTGMLGARDRFLAEDEVERLEAAITRRVAREPLSRILGHREFWSLGIELAPDTLDPRPDSETLVEAILECVPDRNGRLRLLDLGTGSGCLLLALLTELPNAWGCGIDMAFGAARQASANAVRLDLARRCTFAVMDWTAALSGTFDIIVANPPYVRSSEIHGLDPEVREHDPRLALDGGDDGLGAYRHLVPRLPPLLSPDGLVALEVGEGQAHVVAEMLAANGLVDRNTVMDLAGIERVVLGKVKVESPQNQLCKAVSND